LVTFAIDTVFSGHFLMRISVLKNVDYSATFALWWLIVIARLKKRGSIVNRSSCANVVAQKTCVTVRKIRWRHMQISTMTNEELLAKLNELAAQERKLTVQVLKYLNEVEERGLYRDLGYASLFDYCIGALKYSNPSAWRRTKAAECLKANPSIADKIESGELTLCSLTTAAKSIESNLLTVEQIIGRSKREVEALVAKVNPVEAKPREMVKPVVVKASELSLVSAESSKQEERVEIRFSVTKEEYQRLEEAKAKLSNVLGEKLSIEAVVGKLLDGFLKPVKQKKQDTLPSSVTRYIPKALKRAVFARDNRQCSYVSPDGHRCEAKTYLQVDHILPFYVGGRTEFSNLRVLCSCHNRLMAERHFSREHMQKFGQ
jgi:hypothetical protein